MGVGESVVGFKGGAGDCVTGVEESDGRRRIQPGESGWEPIGGLDAPGIHRPSRDPGAEA